MRLFIENQENLFEVLDQPIRFGKVYEIQNGLITQRSFKITKKQFGELISRHRYGKGNRGFHALFFDWKINKGYRFMFYTRAINITSGQLFTVCYDYLVHQIELPWYVNMKYAVDDSKRFKVPLSL